ncbi:MAG: hypothetical protein ABI425_06145 [Patescibacteria group bacterium]
MKILIFTEGTALMHSSAKNVDRNERVRQSSSDLPELNRFGTYIPNGDVVSKLIKWKQQGAEIHYLTSRKIAEEVNDVRSVLEKYSFPDKQNLHFRQEGQEYKDVAEEVLPDVLIEDDCESIGGEKEMTYPHMSSETKARVRSIVTREFEGIDQLPENLATLLSPEGVSPKKEQF